MCKLDRSWLPSPRPRVGVQTGQGSSEGLAWVVQEGRVGGPSWPARNEAQLGKAWAEPPGSLSGTTPPMKRAENLFVGRPCWAPARLPPMPHESH